MKRPNKRKVPEVDAAVEGGPEIEVDTGVTGETGSELEPAPTAAPTEPVLSAAAQKKWDAAMERLVEAEAEAEVLRGIATEHEAKEKIAKRVHDVKMRRLDNGDKLGRRKTWGAARRTYETIIDVLSVQWQCAEARCRAAEAERDAQKAEMRVNELANELF